MILSLVAHEDFEMEQHDVKTAFLHDELEENIFMAQPEELQSREEEKVCQLNMSLWT